MIKVGIIGATGYAGGELVRILAGHGVRIGGSLGGGKYAGFFH